MSRQQGSGSAIGSAGALSQFQAGFARALFAADSGVPVDADLAGLVNQPGFAVYRNTVMKGCIDALQASYPAVARLVGDEWFRAAAAIYVPGNLPVDPCLVDYGATFPAFLAGFGPAKKLPYLAGVARLDRFRTEAHCARDETPLDPAALARLSPEELGRAALRTHPSARWAWFVDYPAYSIWQRNREDQCDSSAAAIDWRGEGALIVRPHDAVESRCLDAAGCAFLDVCAADGSLADAAGAALAADPSADLSALLANLLEAGAFGSLTLHPERDRGERP